MSGYLWTQISIKSVDYLIRQVLWIAEAKIASTAGKIAYQMRWISL
jgi:hypothetical protein